MFRCADPPDSGSQQHVSIAAGARAGPEADSFREWLLAEVRKAIQEEHQRLQEDLDQKRAEQQQQLLDRLLAQQGRQLRSVLEGELRRLLGDKADGETPMDVALSDDAEDMPPPRRKQKHHTWHHRDSCSPSRAGARSPHRQGLAAVASPSGVAIHRNKPVPVLRVPARPSRSTLPTLSAAALSARSASAESTVHGSAAASASTETVRPIEAEARSDGELSHHSASWVQNGQGLVRQDTETQSHFRHEEDEKWRRQWNSHLRDMLKKRLGVRRNRKLLTHTLSDFMGAREASDRARQEKPPAKKDPPNRLECLVDGNAFQLVCSLAILMNGVLIGITTDIGVKNVLANPHQEDPPWFDICNQVFVSLFAFEILIRIAAKRSQYFFGEEWKWNMFDVVLAIYSICEELVHGFALTYARLLRGFRTVRVLRIIRVMRFFRELRLMVCSIVQSLVSLTWAFVLLFLIMYLFSICFMHGTTMYLKNTAVRSNANEKVIDVLTDSYGSLGDTMFSLLLAISGGIDWITLVEPLKEISPVYEVLFSFYVLFVIIGVLNVLTSVFVERANELSRLDRDLVIQSEMVSHETFLNEMKGIFEEVDINGTGRITWKAFHDYLQNEHVQAYFATHQLDTSDARELFNLLDADRDDQVRIEEFVMGCMRLRGQARSSDVATLIRENRKSNQKYTRLIRKVDYLLRNLPNSNRERDADDYEWQSPGSDVSQFGSPLNRRVGVDPLPLAC